MEEFERKDRWSNGYKLIYKPDYYLSQKEGANKGYIYEHIYVATMEIGRPLSKDEVVHHLDHDRANNDVDNLIVLSRSHHARLHAWLRMYMATKSLKWEKRLCECCGSKLKFTLRYCSEACYLEAKAKDIPIRETLIKDMESLGSVLAVGRKYGVSDNAVRKWLRKYSLPLKVSEYPLSS